MMRGNPIELNFMMIKNIYMNTPLFDGDGFVQSALRLSVRPDLNQPNHRASFAQP